MDTSEAGILSMLRDFPPMSLTLREVPGHAVLSLAVFLALLVLTFAECSAQVIINEVLANNHPTSLDDDLDDPPTG